ncbi:MAG: Nucleoside diphosphate kinase [Candidatus Anoxychlamydiales bacterium]|nr:Nucleoside diphosphate kinase [Candidatus Anoxychlamydiales bacterium]
MPQKTLSIIKPDAVKKHVIGKILQKFEENGLKIIALKMVHLKKEDAKKFYMVHKDKPFYESLVEFMTSSPVVVQVLEGENAVEKNREIMGATDFKKAKEGTIRKEFATDIEKNAVHGSDSTQNAEIEIEFFFKKENIFSY